MPVKVGIWFSKLSRGASGGDVWSFTKTLPFLGVVCYFSSSIIAASLSCCFFPSLLCRLAFGPPSEPARRSEKEAAADETPDHENVVMCGGGKATHPTPPSPHYHVESDASLKMPTNAKGLSFPGACTLDNPALDYCPC